MRLLTFITLLTTAFLFSSLPSEAQSKTLKRSVSQTKKSSSTLKKHKKKKLKLNPKKEPTKIKKSSSHEPFFNPPKKLLGLGLMAGTFTSLTGKFRINSKNSIDLAASFETGDKDYFYLHSDFTTQYKEVLSPVDVYWGIGIRFLNQQVPQTATNTESALTEFLLGLRSSVGLEYSISALFTELFAEVSASYNFIHQTDAPEQFKATDTPLESHIGFRFFF
ncbi:MAG: hypothetical protein KDD50_05355 [Bdellovibrionales bacterium]|nr:hypothetical protein [Bdellovibrionales bacterium]